MNAEAATKNDEEMVVMQQTQFDEFGRCLPGQLSAQAHPESRRYFQIEKTELDLQQIYERFDEEFSIAENLSLDSFQQRIEDVINKLSADEMTKAMLNGVYVPFILPKASYQDIGSALEADYLPAIDRAYKRKFADYSFTNHSPKSLTNQLSVTAGSRHQQLLDAMAEDVVVGVYFPCLLEYSVPAAIEQVSTLPESLLLAGGFDTAAAFIAAPELLFKKEGYPPLLWLSGLTSAEDKVGYHFEAYGYDLTFNRRVHLDQVAEYWASGVSILA